jgi:hypothetical protein
VGLLEVDHDVEAVDEDILAEDPEHLIGGNGDLSHEYSPEPPWSWQGWAASEDYVRNTKWLMVTLSPDRRRRRASLATVGRREDARAGVLREEMNQEGVWRHTVI